MLNMGANTMEQEQPVTATFDKRRQLLDMLGGNASFMLIYDCTDHELRNVRQIVEEAEMRAPENVEWRTQCQPTDYTCLQAIIECAQGQVYSRCLCKPARVEFDPDHMRIYVFTKAAEEGSALPEVLRFNIGMILLKKRMAT